MKTICHYLPEMRFRPANRPAMRFKYRDRWRNISWREYFDKTVEVAGALSALGLKETDKIAIMSGSRPEWCFLDMATMGLGGCVVPLYHNISDEDLIFILNDSDASFLFVETIEQVNQWQRVRSRCQNIRHAIVIKRKTTFPEDMIGWKDFIQQGSGHYYSSQENFVKRCEEVKETDVATIIYTSGTTGQPKGVIISHTQISSEIEDTFSKLGVTSRDSCLTFLPYAHVLGRIEIWGQVYRGYSLSFAENIEKIIDNLREIRPTVLVAVPRIFEKIYTSARAKAENTHVGRMSAQWAYDVGQRVSQIRQKKQPISAPLYMEYMVAKKMVFSKVTEALGGRLRFAISGGAPLSVEIAQFFHAADILILEGYGLTETTAAVCVNTPWDFRFGTVGKPIGDVELKVNPDGEILIRSKKVMVGYHKNPESTDQTIRNGWLHTGDIGNISPEGFLTITDRKKDLIKTTGGKYVAPQKLENLLRREPLVSNALIHGDDRRYIVALVTLDEDQLKEYAKTNGLDFVDVEAFIKNRRVQKKMQQVVADVNSRLSSYETIKKFAILPRDFTVEDGELTPSMKIKRKYCDSKYGKQIDSLY